MSRTYGGWLFTCKVCGNPHLMDSGEPHDGIRVSCVNGGSKNYKEKDFEHWHGYYADVFDILVKGN